MKDFKELEVWQKSVDFVLNIYETSKSFPHEEMFSLTNQMRRSAVSIPSNISEGFSRNSTKEFIQFLYIALGSSAELETQILISHKLGYLIDPTKLIDNLTTIKKMLNALVSSLKGKIKQS
ncbi:MAG: four helix bundle protein [Proteobacteria bacterium]|nr:four helix bundle protein [Pseudomonadota bacterium]